MVNVALLVGVPPVELDPPVADAPAPVPVALVETVELPALGAAGAVTTGLVITGVVEIVGSTRGATTLIPAAWSTVTEAGTTAVAEARACAQPVSAATAATVMTRSRFIVSGLDQRG
jgi:hypothetical protein